MNRAMATPLLWRAIGVTFLLTGVYGLLNTRGLDRTLLSALAFPGLLVALYPPPWNDRRLAVAGTVLGIVGALSVPVALVPQIADADGSSICSPSASPYEEGDNVSTAVVPFSTDDAAAIARVGPEEWAVRFPNLRWAGLYASVPDDVCSYQVDFDALETPPSTSTPGAGWGYGSGVCNKVSPAGPTGPSVQYSFLNSKGKVVGFTPRVNLPEANTSMNNSEANLSRGDINYNWNHWTIKVERDTATYYLNNDTKLDSFPIQDRETGQPADCADRGFFFRAWGAESSLRNLRITAGAD